MKKTIEKDRGMELFMEEKDINQKKKPDDPAEQETGKRKSGLLTFNGNQCKQNTARLGKCCAKRSTGSSQMEKSDKQIIQYNIHRTCNCDEIHRTFRIPQSAENRTDQIICRNKWNPEKTDRQISCRS